MSNPYRIIFMGTPDFAAVQLKTLCGNGYRPIAVYTQPDKINGRGNRITFSDVKKLAMEENIPVYQPTTFKSEDTIRELAALKPDLIIVVAYGKILPVAVIDAAVYGAINIHASLLPEYRGSAPIQRAIIDRKSETGISIMKLDAGMDTGDIIRMAPLKILPHMTAGELFESLSVLGAKELLYVLKNLPESMAGAKPQDHAKATYAEKVTKEMGHIDWEQEASVIDALIRGMYPSPGTYTYFHGKRIKIHAAFYENSDTAAIPKGTVVSLKDGNIGVAAMHGIIYLTMVQPENHKRMKTIDFINGYQVKTNDCFEY